MKKYPILLPHSTGAAALIGETLKRKKLNVFSHMLYYSSARLQPAAD